MTTPGVVPITKKRDDAVAAAPRGTRLSDTGNAERFAMQHGTDLRYCHPWRSWMVWDGRRWVRDESGEVTRRAKATVQAMYFAAAAVPESERERLAKHAIRSDQRQRIAAMIELAQSEPGIPVLPAEFDASPWQLNVLNGTLDLRTGELRAPGREDLLTKLVHVAYDERATCPRWDAFLTRILAGDVELIDFLQRAVGYSLTGITREHCFFFLHGSGGNGKSTLLEVLRALLGELATQADFATFLERKSERGPRDLARLFGARLVTAVEAGEGKRFDEAALKSITGGDMITACRVFEQAFEFRPTFKIWFAANHRPAIRGADRGMWRRVRLIPFEVEIPEAEFDRDLERKLVAELPGILAWAARGCLEWQLQGLGTPAKVSAATADYRADMDTFGDFLSECCELGEFHSVPASLLFAAYREWSGANNEPPMSQTSFGRKLSDRGFGKVKSGPANGIQRVGLRLRGHGGGQLRAEVQNSPYATLSREVPENRPNCPEPSAQSEQQTETDDRGPVDSPVVPAAPEVPPPKRERIPGTCVVCGRTGLLNGAAICAGGLHLARSAGDRGYGAPRTASDPMESPLPSRSGHHD